MSGDSLKRKMMMNEFESAAFDCPFFEFGHPADAWPAFLREVGEVLKADEIDWHILTLFLGSLLASWISDVDIV
jgi:hypothetical protein